jgi:hypothetical protein
MAKPFEASAIQELLSPWNITYTNENDADVSIVYGQKPLSKEHSVVIPSNTESFKAWTRKNQVQVVPTSGSQFIVPVTPSASLSIKPKITYLFDSKPSIFFDEFSSPSFELGEDTIALKMDLVTEFYDNLLLTLKPPESKMHRIATSMPFAYSLIPKNLRNFLIRSRHPLEDLTLTDKLPIDALRFILVNAIEKASDRPVEKKGIYSDNYICILTHDIESASGLQRAKVMKKIENKYDIGSAWYIPSKRFKLEHSIIKEIEYHGEIGVHDTRHDGKLAHLPKKKLVERLSQAKDSMETIIEHRIEGFRAPVLQHNQHILSALKKSGYKYDTSIPTWEPKHPFTMKPHGIGTVYPISINGLLEIPLTLPQDHQLLYVLGLTPKEVMRTWAIMATLIRELGGVCMFLVHPDYKFGDPYTNLYEELLNVIVNDSKATVTLPSRFCGLINEYQSNESCSENSIELGTLEDN